MQDKGLGYCQNSFLAVAPSVAPHLQLGCPRPWSQQPLSCHKDHASYFQLINDHLDFCFLQNISIVIYTETEPQGVHIHVFGTQNSNFHAACRKKNIWVGSIHWPAAHASLLNDGIYCASTSLNPLMYSAFAIELSDLSKPFKFARLKGFERLENCLIKGTYQRFWKVKQLSEQTYHSPIFLPFKSFQRVLKGVVVQ